MASITNTAAGTRKVIVHTPEPKASAALYVFELVNALSECAVPVTLFCPSNFEYELQLRSAGIDMVQAPPRPVSNAGLAARLWRNAAWVARTAALQFRITKPGDVVHFQFLIHLPLGLLLLLLARMQGASIVLTAHDPLPHKWRLPASLRWLEWKMLSWAYRLCQRIIVHNQVGKALLLSEFRYPAERIAIVPHGPLASIPHNPDCREIGVLRLLLFGSIRENKGIHLAIEAVQNLNASPGCPVRLTIAGSITATHHDYWSRCKKLISGNPAGIDVIERYFDDSELAPLFSEHHAVLLPYLDFFSESGVASLALSNQRPIIATGAGGLAELLRESAGGILISSPTVPAVQAAIKAAVDLGYQKLRTMGVEGGRYLRVTRSWETIAESTREVYSSLAGPSPILARNLAA